MNEILADDELAQWKSDVRSHPAEARPLDVNKLRVARVRPAGPSLPQVLELSVPGDNPVNLRFDRPNGHTLPLIVYVHGRAFIIGDLDSHDRTCRRLGLEANAAVLAVHYRRAPEHPAPAAIDDVLATLRWAAALAWSLRQWVPDMRPEQLEAWSPLHVRFSACLRPS